jgi:hypothetical protein
MGKFIQRKVNGQKAEERMKLATFCRFANPPLSADLTSFSQNPMKTYHQSGESQWIVFGRKGRGFCSFPPF